MVIEIPNDIKAEPKGAVHKISTGNHRYLARRVGAPNVASHGDRKIGVTLFTSYGSADQSSPSYWVYVAPSFSAVESAAKASGWPFESIVEIPETLYPN